MSLGGFLFQIPPPQLSDSHCCSCRPWKMVVRVLELSLLRRPCSRGIARTDVLALNGGDRGAETQTDVFVPSPATLAWAGGLDLGLAVEEDWRLLAVLCLSVVVAVGRPLGREGQTYCAAASGKRARSAR